MPKSLPKPVYPIALDSDYTLFKTYNSSQSVLVKNLAEGDDKIYIQPQSPNKAEIWAENGFVTIQDELIYYDAVEKDSNGKVSCLKDCIRGVEGTAQAYRSGTPIAANAVAQTHNQLVETIMAIEKTIGEVGDMLRMGPELKAQRNVKKNFVPRATEAAQVDHNFSASLQQSLVNILGITAMGEDVCPEVEFEFNNIAGVAEYCVRIFGSYNSFTIDFDDGSTVNNQLAGTHTYAGLGPYNPTITVVANNCTIVQMPTTPNEFTDGPTLPNPAVPFVVTIPDFPAMPSFAPPSQTCPGPLFNLPPIMFPDATICSNTSISSSCAPSVIISVVEACTTPQIISISSPCVLSNISLVGIPSVITLIGSLPNLISLSCISFCNVPSFQCVSFCSVPSFDPISFTTPSFAPISFAKPNFDCISFCSTPSFEPISFANVPTFSCISFCNVPDFGTISFAAFPTIPTVSFDVLVDLSIAPVCFCDPPSFQPIKFDNPPTISVNWGTPPTVSVVIQCPSTTGGALPFAPPLGMTDFDASQYSNNLELPVDYGGIGIPNEIFLRHDMPKSISVSHDLPTRLVIDATSVPRTILVEPSENLPSVFKLEIGNLPKIEVTGVPTTISIVENIPRTIQLVMPEDPTVTMRWDGVPVEMKPSPELKELLSKFVVPPR